VGIFGETDGSRLPSFSNWNQCLDNDRTTNRLGDSGRLVGRGCRAALGYQDSRSSKDLFGVVLEYACHRLFHSIATRIMDSAGQVKHDHRKCPAIDLDL
jgi:hypothetical protein